MSVGDNIKNARKKANLTQKDLAKLLSVRPSAISQFEHSDNLSIKTLEKIANALKVDINSLLNIEVEKGFIKPTNSLDFLKKPKTTIETTDDNFVKIADYYYKLNHEGREKALDLVELLTKVSDYHRDDN